MMLEGAELEKLQNLHIQQVAKARLGIVQLSTVRALAELMALRGVAEGIPASMLKPGPYADKLTHRHAGEFGKEYWSKLEARHAELIAHGKNDVSKVLEFYQPGLLALEIGRESGVPSGVVQNIIGHLHKILPGEDCGS